MFQAGVFLFILLGATCGILIYFFRKQRERWKIRRDINEIYVRNINLKGQNNLSSWKAAYAMDCEHIYCSFP